MILLGHNGRLVSLDVLSNQDLMLPMDSNTPASKYRRFAGDPSECLGFASREKSADTKLFK